MVYLTLQDTAPSGSATFKKMKHKMERDGVRESEAWAWSHRGNSFLCDGLRVAFYATNGPGQASKDSRELAVENYASQRLKDRVHILIL